MEDVDGEDHRKQNTTEPAVDSLSALPVEVIYQIMEHLTLRDAAKMSALSRSWRKIWLSLPCIVFDQQFFWFLRDGSVERRSERSVYSIMHRILLLHEGPIVKFTTDFTTADPFWDISLWLSYISKSVRELTVCADFVASSSHVLFSCSKLRILKLRRGTVSIPPTFTGFSNLVTLELEGVLASGDDGFGSLIHTSSQLEKLVLSHCRGFGDIVIDFPLLRTLHIGGTWESICFKSAPNLKVAHLGELQVLHLGNEKALAQFIRSLIHTSSLLEVLWLPDKGFEDIVLDSPLLRILGLSGQSICLKNAPNLIAVFLSGNYVENLDYEKALNLINFLASSCTIETLAVDDIFGELFVKDDAGENILTFDHVKHLGLHVNNLEIGNGFVYVTSMMRTCPNMAHLLINLENCWEDGEIFESCHNCTLDHLRQIYILGFKGLTVELKLMEFLLKSSPQLVKLGIVKDEGSEPEWKIPEELKDSEPEWKIPEELMMFPKASSEAEVIVVDEVGEFLMEKFCPTSWS